MIFFWKTPSLSFWPLADLCAPSIALGQSIGRIGCLMAGDDYGRPASVPWAVTFTDPDAANIGRRDNLRNEIATIDDSLKDMRSSLVPAQNMKALLQDVLARNPRLQLVAMRRLIARHFRAARP